MSDPAPMPPLLLVPKEREPGELPIATCDPRAGTPPVHENILFNLRLRQQRHGRGYLREEEAEALLLGRR
jgi:hypothetical protein